MLAYLSDLIQADRGHLLSGTIISAFLSNGSSFLFHVMSQFLEVLESLEQAQALSTDQTEATRQIGSIFTNLFGHKEEQSPHALQEFYSILPTFMSFFQILLDEERFVLSEDEKNKNIYPAKQVLLKWTEENRRTRAETQGDQEIKFVNQLLGIEEKQSLPEEVYTDKFEACAAKAKLGQKNVLERFLSETDLIRDPRYPQSELLNS